jgi:DegV family protein with EDD domain
MKYTLIADSCCDLRDADLTHGDITFYTVPLTVQLGPDDYLDEEGLDTQMLVDKMRACKTAAKTACPSPEAFAEKMRLGADRQICVTITSKLSGTYNSARLAAETVMAEDPKKKIFILDTLSATAGQARLLFKLVEFIESGKYDADFDALVAAITAERDKMKTRFVLNDLSNLVKTGRMSKVLGIIASVIPIKLICGEDGKGEIKKYKQALGMRKALEVLAELPGEVAKTDGPDNASIVITHCHNHEGASVVQKILKSKFGFKNIKILLMRGLATFFANYKGVAVAY